MACSIPRLFIRDILASVKSQIGILLRHQAVVGGDGESGSKGAFAASAEEVKNWTAKSFSH